MPREHSIWRKLLDISGLEEENIPGRPVAELFDDNRLLIENHKKIMRYERNQICVTVRYGTLCVLGSNLQLRRISENKLLITGKIDRLDLQRRVCP